MKLVLTVFLWFYMPEIKTKHSETQNMNKVRHKLWISTQKIYSNWSHLFIIVSFFNSTKDHFFPQSQLL